MGTNIDKDIDQALRDDAEDLCIMFPKRDPESLAKDFKKGIPKWFWQEFGFSKKDTSQLKRIWKKDISTEVHWQR